MLAGGCAVTAWLPGTIRLHRPVVIAACVACIPLIQFGLSLIPFAGQALLVTAYLMGLALALLVGSHAELSHPNFCIDWLFLAIGAAAVGSVGLQLYQWLDLAEDGLGLWIMLVPNARPFANLGQPNQLATFLIWGLLALGWGHHRGFIGGPVTAVAGTYLLFGIALSQSRTALIAVFGLLFAACHWRRLLPGRAYLPSLAGMVLAYLLFMLAIPWLLDILGLLSDPGMLARSSKELRLPAYRLFLDAAGQSPWVGYGWASTAAAQLAVAERHESLEVIFMHSHNLFLDLVLWCGAPVGGLLSCLLVGWFYQKLRRIDALPNAILLAFVAVVAWHAMLEFPLHYAYMLLPVGLVAGVLNARLAEPVWMTTNRWHLGAALLVAVGLLGAITRDYLRVEENFMVLRFERARIGPKQVDPMASVWLLDHMNEFVRLGRTPARRGLTQSELTWMGQATLAFPSQANLFTYASALAMNQQVEQARLLVAKLAHICAPDEYEQMKRIWQAQANEDASLALVVWPDRLDALSKP